MAQAGISFMIAKASEVIEDETYKRNVAGAMANGIIPFPYHFLSHDRPARLQADLFLSVINYKPGMGLGIPCVDVEPDPLSKKALFHRGGAYGTSWPADHMVRLLDDFLTYVH